MTWHVSIDDLDYLILCEWCVTYRVDLWTSACHKPSLRWNASHLQSSAARWTRWTAQLLQCCSPATENHQAMPGLKPVKSQHLLTLAEFTKVHEQILTPCEPMSEGLHFVFKRSHEPNSLRQLALVNLHENGCACWLSMTQLSAFQLQPQIDCIVRVFQHISTTLF